MNQELTSPRATVLDAGSSRCSNIRHLGNWICRFKEAEIVGLKLARHHLEWDGFRSTATDQLQLPHFKSDLKRPRWSVCLRLRHYATVRAAF